MSDPRPATTTELSTSQKVGALVLRLIGAAGILAAVSSLLAMALAGGGSGQRLIWSILGGLFSLALVKGRFQRDIEPTRD